MTQSELRSNIDVVLYALLELEGYERKVHTEEIAFRAYQLAKERFGWRLERFRDYPDKEPARFALEDAAKQKNGRLVRGRSGTATSGKEADGWILTPAGVAWIREHRIRIEAALGAVRPQTRPKDAERFQKRIAGQALFMKFSRGEPITKDDWYDFTGMLNTSPDAPKDIIVRKLEGLRSTAQMVADPQLVSFLDACCRAFPECVADSCTHGDRKEGGS